VFEIGFALLKIGFDWLCSWLCFLCIFLTIRLSAIVLNFKCQELVKIGFVLRNCCFLAGCEDRFSDRITGFAGLLFSVFIGPLLFWFSLLAQYTTDLVIVKYFCDFFGFGLRPGTRRILVLCLWRLSERRKISV